jgi:hypothetical protein
MRSKLASIYLSVAWKASRSRTSIHPTRRAPFEGNGYAEVINIGGRIVGRGFFEPEWRWSNNVKPIAGTDSCPVSHLGYITSRRMKVYADDGSSGELGPRDVYALHPEHDAEVVGDEACVSLDFGEFWRLREASLANRAAIDSPRASRGRSSPVRSVRALRFGELKRDLFSAKMGSSRSADPGGSKGEACGTNSSPRAAGLSTFRPEREGRHRLREALIAFARRPRAFLGESGRTGRRRGLPPPGRGLRLRERDVLSEEAPS